MYRPKNSPNAPNAAQNFPKGAKNHQNGPKWTNMDQNLPKTAKWAKLLQNNSNLLKTA